MVPRRQGHGRRGDGGDGGGARRLPTGGVGSSLPEASERLSNEPLRPKKHPPLTRTKDGTGGLITNSQMSDSLF